MGDRSRLDWARVRWLRLRAQRLVGVAPGGDGAVAAVVSALCGVQAQYAEAAALSVRARTAGSGRPTAADVERARVEQRAIVRTWCQRGTLHLVAAEDLGWLLGLLGPLFVRGSRRRYAELGLDEATYARAVGALREALAGRGPQTRGELVEQLDRRGVRLEGQARPHLLGRAALEGVLCFGPERDGQPSYVLLSDWLPGAVAERAGLPREAALAELARRYLAGHGPAGPEDLAAWSGLGMADARDAWARLAPELVELALPDRTAWRLAGSGQPEEPDAPPAPPTVRLVAGYDPYLLGYRDRGLVVPPEHARRVHPGGGLLRPTLLVDGVAAGTWRVSRRRARLEVTVEPFGRLDPSAEPALASETADLGRFLGAPAALRVGPPAAG